MTTANISYEPMDVDVSGNSTTHMDISYSDEPHMSEFRPVAIKQEVLDNEEILDNLDDSRTITPVNNFDSIKLHPNQAGVKVYHIMKKNEVTHTITSTHIIVSFIIVAFISVIALKIMNVNCSGELDPYSLSEKLHRRIYGQYLAVTDIVTTLKDESRSKVLFFYGGTGVGKSYTVSLMLENSWNYTNIYHYTMPSFLTTFTTDLMLGLTMCDTVYFIVDDLIPTDLMNVRNHIKDVVQKSNELNKNIIIILIFSCDNTDKDYTRKCDDTFYKKATESFSNIEALKQFIKFEELTETHLKKCIEDELGQEYVDDVKLMHILKNFNVSLDGCKGVQKKIKYLSNI